MFYVSQKPNIKRSPNGIKTDGELFWNIYDFGKKNQRETVPEGATRQGGASQGAGAPLTLVGICKAVDALLFLQEN